MIGRLSLFHIVVIAIVAIVLYHAWQRRQGNIAGPPHKAKPGTGAAA